MSHIIHFLWVYQVLAVKIQISMSFLWDFDKFSNSEFPRFVATLLQWQQQIICCKVNSDGLKVQLEKESYENDQYCLIISN